MKKYTIYKTVQLVLLVLAAICVLGWIFAGAGIYHLVATDSTIKLLAVVVWAILLMSFLFVFLDYSFFFNYRKEYKEMEIAAVSDRDSGIANRLSCDLIIEKHLDKELPDNLGVIMINLTNIQEINEKFGHLQGNITIRDFSNILRLSSTDLCFVGRNGGNKYLAVFEDSDEENLRSFMDIVNRRVLIHNNSIKNGAIEYSCGVAYSGTDKVRDITSLISLANSRIPAENK